MYSKVEDHLFSGTSNFPMAAEYVSQGEKRSPVGAGNGNRSVLFQSAVLPPLKHHR
jgi:hypothetical protein